MFEKFKEFLDSVILKIFSKEEIRALLIDMARASAEGFAKGLIEKK